MLRKNDQGGALSLHSSSYLSSGDCGALHVLFLYDQVLQFPPIFQKHTCVKICE